jgi:hypothetical protein
MISFHDKLALKARREGRRKEDFRDAAQKHANASWFFVGDRLCKICVKSRVSSIAGTRLRSD